MDPTEAITNLIEKFTSGNNIEVQRSTITREEWEAVFTKIKNHALKIAQLEQLVRNQKLDIRNMQEALEHKNRALDALHWVWCDGGCPAGVHRYKEMKDKPLTEAIVREAEFNTLRLRTWFGNFTFRNHDGTYKRAPLHWRIILWLGGLSWKRFLKKQRG